MRPILPSIITASLIFHDVACFRTGGMFRPQRPAAVVRLRQSSADVRGDETTTTTTSGPPAMTARELTCSFDGGDTYQLDEANYVLPRGSRVGLVGRNGCGKSTFLRILAEASGSIDTSSPRSLRDNVPYTGGVEVPKDLTVAFVEQEPPSPSDITVSDALLGVTGRAISQQSTSGGGGGGVNKVYQIVRDYRLPRRRDGSRRIRERRVGHGRVRRMGGFDEGGGGIDATSGEEFGGSALELVERGGEEEGCARGGAGEGARRVDM